MPRTLLLNIKLEMFFSKNSRAENPAITADKSGLWISRTKGVQGLKLLDLLQTYRLKQYFAIMGNRRQQILRTEQCCCGFLKTVAERSQLFCLDRQPGSHGMAAKPYKIFSTLLQGPVQVKIFDRAGGALPHPGIKSDHDRWAMITLHQTTGNDTDHPGMPTFIGQNNGMTHLLRLFCECSDGLFQGLLFNLLPFAVEFIQQFCQLCRFLWIIAEQQFNS